MSDLYDVIIIGGGAAGLSAALTLGRCCRDVLVCDDGRPRNAVAERMHGFLSRDDIPPGEFLTIARRQLQRYAGVEVIDAHVCDATREEAAFRVRTLDDRSYAARRLLLATGLYDALPDIAGLRERWGKTVFVCPYCDGWEYRGRRLAAIGKGRRAVELAQELHQWSDSLIVCAGDPQDLHEDDRRWLSAVQACVRLGQVTAIGGNGDVTVAFADGPSERCAAVFVSAPLRARYPLVDMLGCRVRSDGEIEVDSCGQTSVKGCYAAGDAVAVIHQVAIAAASGVRAAIGINDDLIAEEVRAVVRNIP